MRMKLMSWHKTILGILIRSGMPESSTNQDQVGGGQDSTRVDNPRKLTRASTPRRENGRKLSSTTMRPRRTDGTPIR